MAITDEGTSQSFSYTGGIQTFTVPFTGIYKLEVWGAKGGNAYTASGGNGGYAIGYTELKKDDVLYIVCGGQGSTANETTVNGGYNGGGAASAKVEGNYAGSGGGATHIAKVSGTLKSIGKTSFVTNQDGFIVAGGGGGAYYKKATGYGARAGGSGGGTTGGSGSGYDGVPNPGGGTQTGGYSFGEGASYVNGGANSGGGGGLYGGSLDYYSGSGGGSGWIDGVPEITFKGVTYSPSMSNGTNSGNGKATITLEKKGGFPTVYFNGTLLDGITFDGVEIDTVIFNGITLS